MKDIVFKTLMLKGENGSSIVSFSKISTEGVVDTYAINFSDGTQATFEVTNGDSIASIEKTATTGTVDTYTITLDSGNTETFEVTNGESYEVPTGGVILLDSPATPTGYEIINNPLSGATTSLKFAKKVSDTNIKGYGNIIDSFNTGDDKTTNAPSLAAVEKRANNNLLANSSFEPLDIDSTFAGNSIGAYFAGWSINGTGHTFGSPFFYLFAGGLAVPTTLPYACYLDTYWYNVDGLDLDYITVSLEYKTSVSGDWIEVEKTFNASTQSPSSQYMFTAYGCVVSVSPFESGALRIEFSATPTSEFYIRRVKLERGTSATPFIDDLTDVNLAFGAARAALNTLDNSEFSPRYKDSLTFDYFGGGVFRVNTEEDASSDKYYEILFNLPFSKTLEGAESKTVILNSLRVDDVPNGLATNKVEIHNNGGANPYIRLLFSAFYISTLAHELEDRGFICSIAANITIQ